MLSSSRSTLDWVFVVVMKWWREAPSMRLTVFLLKVLHQLSFFSWSIGWMISSVVEWPLVCSALNISQDGSIKVSQMQLLVRIFATVSPIPQAFHERISFHFQRNSRSKYCYICLILGLSWCSSQNLILDHKQYDSKNHVW